MPVPIEDSEIHALQVATSAAVGWGPWPFINIGQEVEIRRGPLSGIRGTLVRFNNRQRLIITVNLLMQSAFVEIEGDEVTPIGCAAGMLNQQYISQHRLAGQTMTYVAESNF